MTKRVLGPIIAAVLLALLTLMPHPARASCDAQHAQLLAKTGYRYLDQHRWSDAKTAAGDLVLLSQDCDDSDVRIPAVLHSAYIGSAALHGLGDDAKASEAVKAGLMLLDMLQKSGEYKSLYDAMEPRFIALQRELKA